jgi:uncharacterized protein DUF4339
MFPKVTPKKNNTGSFRKIPMAIYIFKNGKQDGPLEEAIVCFHLAHGILSPDDLGWREGMSDWAPLREIYPKRPEVKIAIDAAARRPSISEMPAR